MDDAIAAWPELSYHSWRETAATLQLWTQIVGKVRLTLTPWICLLYTSPSPRDS